MNICLEPKKWVSRKVEKIFLAYSEKKKTDSFRSNFPLKKKYISINRKGFFIWFLSLKRRGKKKKLDARGKSILGKKLAKKAIAPKDMGTSTILAPFFHKLNFTGRKNISVWVYC